MRLVEHFYRLIAPSHCMGCQTEGPLLCLWCVDDLLPAEESRCYRCNRLSKGGQVCPACRRKTALKHVFTRTEYTSASKELVHKMKFSYSGEAADLIARELMSTIPALPANTLIVHVPTITSHVRQRGFDHAARIAREFSKLSGYRHVPALTRLGQHRQVGSKRKERLESMDGAFRAKAGFLLQNRPVLLIDDVLTTGATLESAARTLKEAGAKSVDAAVFARAR